MAERKKVDWEAIERDFRAGVFSILEIAKQHGISDAAIHKHAKLHGWKRDLAARVRKLVSEKLVRQEVSKPNASDEEIAEEATVAPVRIVGLHRRDSRQQQEIVERLMAIVKERLADDSVKPGLDDVRQMSGIMRDCSMALSKLVTIERQAYNLDEDGRRPDPIDEIAILVVSPEAKGE